MAPRILVVDGQATVTRTLSWVLREHGYDVVTAQHAREVLGLLSDPPDLAVLDFEVAEGGESLVERLRQADGWQDVPLVVTATLPADEGTLRSLRAGAADYLQKPLRARELLVRIASHLRTRTSLRVARDALRTAEGELSRVREAAEQRRTLVDILHGVTERLAADEIHHLVSRRVARALDLQDCVVLLEDPGGRLRVVAAAYEQATARDDRALAELPAVVEARRTGAPALLAPVAMDEAAEAGEGATEPRPGAPVPSTLAVPFVADAAGRGVVVLWRGPGQPRLAQGDLEFVETVVRAAVAAVERSTLLQSTREDNRRLEVLAQTDPLTGVLNRRALAVRLDEELERARRYNAPVSCLMLDLDHFKRINDRHGHPVGDEVLATVGELLQRAVRAVDAVARFGGEEFAVVLPATSTEGAFIFAERIRAMIGEQVFHGEGGAAFHVSASIGVATFPSLGSENPVQLLASADRALYRAKEQGRNRVSA